MHFHLPKWVLFAFALSTSFAALAAPPPGFDQRVEQLRIAFGVPGVSIAIVEDGHTTLARGWGVRRIGAADQVDADTIFGTGSTGKAFTTAALAVLVDQGKLGWDDKVIDRMPDFRMWDPWVTREMTVRDLLVHRSGLGPGAGDLLFFPNSNLSRKESVRRLRYIKPATSFRSGFAYDNVLFMVAGQLIEEVSGETWEKFVRGHVLGPLDMNHATVSDAEYAATPNRAHPHSRSGGGIVGLGPQQPVDEGTTLSANVAPAGGLSISANEMTHWLLTQLGHGKAPRAATRLYSEAQAEEMWNPVTIEPIDPPLPQFTVFKPNFLAYALGWEVRDYRGTMVVWHGGAVPGSLTWVVLVPSKNVGLFIAINSEDFELANGLKDELLDHYLGLPPGQWPEKIHTYNLGRLGDVAKEVAKKSSSPAIAGPSLSLDHYAGDYADPWFGTIKVRRSGASLDIEFPHSTGMSGPLTHYQRDTFRTNPTQHWIEPAFVTFALDPAGKVSRVTMLPVSPSADFSFDFQDLDFAPVAAAAAAH